MIFRHFSNQPLACTTTSTQSRMTTTDSLTNGKPDSERPTQDTVKPEHTGPSTDPIGSSTGSLGLTHRLYRNTLYDYGYSRRSARSSHSSTSRWPHWAGHRSRRTHHCTGSQKNSAPSMPRTATSPNATSLPDSPTACCEGPTALSLDKPLSSATATSARVGDPTGSTVPNTTSSAADSTDLIRAEASKVVFSSRT